MTAFSSSTIASGVLAAVAFIWLITIGVQVALRYLAPGYWTSQNLRVLLSLCGATSGIASFIYFRGQPDLGIVASLAVLAPLSVLIDFKKHKLPDLNTALMSLTTAVGVSIWIWQSGTLTIGIRALLGGILGAGFLFFLHLVGGIGLGDVKLAFPLSAWLSLWGISTVLGWLFLSFIFAGIWALVLMFARRIGLKSHVALGPWLIVGAFVLRLVI